MIGSAIAAWSTRLSFDLAVSLNFRASPLRRLLQSLRSGRREGVNSERARVHRRASPRFERLVDACTGCPGGLEQRNKDVAAPMSARADWPSSERLGELSEDGDDPRSAEARGAAVGAPLLAHECVRLALDVAHSASGAWPGPQLAERAHGSDLSEPRSRCRPISLRPACRSSRGSGGAEDVAVISTSPD